MLQKLPLQPMYSRNAFLSVGMLWRCNMSKCSSQKTAFGEGSLVHTFGKWSRG